LLLVLGSVVVDGVTAGYKHRAFKPLWSLASPGYVLYTASAWGRSAYWNAVLVTQAVAWAMLAVACVVVPHTWQERKKAGASSSRGWVYAWKYGGIRRRQRLRRKLLERWPIAWLGCRERWQAWGLWTVTVLAVGGFASTLLYQEGREGWIIWNYLGGPVVLILYLWAASQACRFLAEARRSGFLELLLATPVDEQDIVRGQWRALLRMFALPVLLLVGLQAGGAALSQLSFQSIGAKANAAASSAATNASTTSTVTTTATIGNAHVSVSTGTNVVAAPSGFWLANSRHEISMAVVSASATALATLGNLLALCWFGMWMGMTSRSANLATLKTILFVQILPWFVIAFGTSVVVGVVVSRVFLQGNTGQPGAFFQWWPLLSAVLGTALALAKDLGFILWSRKKLLHSLREEAGHNPGESRFAALPPLPQVAPAPPLLAAPQ
jgi:hypothetical protein